MKIGITGLPQSGKTTVFSALSKSKLANPQRNEPNQAVVKVPDQRLSDLAALFKPKKFTPAEVQYVDVALPPREAGPRDSGAQTTALLRQCDALLLVIRAFQNDSVAHPEGSIDPVRDCETLTTEMLLSDLAVVDKRLERLEREMVGNKGTEAERQLRQREFAALQRIQSALGDGHPARSVELTEEDMKLLRGYGFLSLKPWLLLLNTDDGQSGMELRQSVKERWNDPQVDVDRIAASLETELWELDPAEAAEYMSAYGLTEPALDRVIQTSYRLLNLISFFTVGEDEVRAWTIRRGASAVEAAGAIHTSIAKAFIRAEVIRWDELLACGTHAEARKRGLLRSEGKTYVVQDGDIAEFLHGA